MQRPTFCTRSYVASHGKAPRGTGRWAFDVAGNWCFTPSAMSYANAKAWAAEQAAAVNCAVVRVGP
jgi:hypothetical protein